MSNTNFNARIALLRLIRPSQMGGTENGCYNLRFLEKVAIGLDVRVGENNYIKGTKLVLNPPDVLPEGLEINKGVDSDRNTVTSWVTYMIAMASLAISLNYETRMKDRNPLRWAVASQIALTNFLFSFRCHVPHKALMRRFESMAVEAVYDKIDLELIDASELTEEEKAQLQELFMDFGGFMIEKSDVDPSETDSSNNKDGKKSLAEGGDSTLNYDSLCDEIAKRVRNGQWQGEVPDHIKERIRRMSSPTVPFDHFLAKHLASNIVGGTDIGYSTEIDRAQLLNTGLVESLPTKKKLGSIIFCYDVSGSMSKKELGKIAEQLYRLSNYYDYKQLILIAFDDKVLSYKIHTNETRLENLDYAGGGGTTLQPVWDRLEEEGLFADRRNQLIILSDMGLSIPDEPPVNTLWICTSSDPWVKPDYGIFYSIAHDI